MKVEIVAPTVATKHVPDKDVLMKCHELGQTIAAQLKTRTA